MKHADQEDAIAVADRGKPVSLWAALSLLPVPAISAFAAAGLTPVLSKISAQFSSTPGAETIVRGMISGQGVGVVVGATLAGMLAERLGERLILLVMLPFFALFGSAGFVLADPWAILASRVLVGVTVGAASVVSLAMLMNGVSVSSRNTWQGFSAVAGTLGGLLLVPLAGFLGAVDWRYVFLIHLVSVPIFAAVLILFPRRGHVMPQRESAARKSALPFSILFLGIASGIAAGTIMIYLPFYFTAIGLPDPELVAVAVMATTASCTISAMSYGWLRRYFDVRQVFVLAFLLISGGLVVLVWGGTFVSALVGIAVAGLGMGVTTPNLFAVAAAAHPQQRARRIGVARSGYYLAPLLAQFALEPVALNFGPAGALLAVGLFAVSMVGVVFLTGRALVPKGPLLTEEA